MRAVIETSLRTTSDTCVAMKCKLKKDREGINQQLGHEKTVVSERVRWGDAYVNQEKLLQLTS